MTTDEKLKELTVVVTKLIVLLDTAVVPTSMRAIAFQMELQSILQEVSKLQ